jgi:hypothetical protein
MTKGETLVIRISAEDKAMIQNAADLRGQSASAFVTAVAIREAREVQNSFVLANARERGRKGVHRGLPTWFRASCREAAQGGTNNYRWVGQKLLGSLANEVPSDLENDEWYEELQKRLDPLLAGKDNEALLAWFLEHMPRFIKQIPQRRYHQFFSGLRDEYKESGIEI